jgi:SAM-dependent methyltransferase
MDAVVIALALISAIVALVGWLGYQLFVQNGRILLRLEAVERQLAQLRRAFPRDRAPSQLTVPSTLRVIWQPDDVVDARDAAFATRTYLEHADVRSFVAQAAVSRQLDTACEVGAGYGRMTMVLSEFARRVVGLEREPHFVAEASRLHPGIEFVQVESLTELPLPTASVEFVLAFTVLQHLIDAVVEPTAREIDRILRPGGHLLLCEETDPSQRGGDVDDPNGNCIIGRPVGEHQRLFGRFDLVSTEPRRVEPTYARPDTGTYMLFRKRED